jgi:hypothetical protein
MIEFPSFPESKFDTLTDQEIESATEKVALLLGALNDTKHDIIKKNMGDELYQSAILQLNMLHGTEEEPEPSVDDLLKLDEIDRRKNADFAELIISIDRADDAYIEILYRLANKLFQSESLEEITNDPEKLALFGFELKKLFSRGYTPTSKEVDKLVEESSWADIKITNACKKHIRNDIIQASVDVRGNEVEFDLYIDDVPQETIDEILGNESTSYDQRLIEVNKLSDSVSIRIEGGTLSLNHEAVTTPIQLERIIKSLEQLPNIIKDLELELV